MYLTITISDDSSPLGRLRQRKYAEDAFGDFFASCQASTDQKMWNQSYKIKIYCLSRFAPIWANFNMIRHMLFKLHCPRYRFSQTIQSFLKSSIFVDTPVMLEKHESQSPCPMSILLSFSLFLAEEAVVWPEWRVDCYKWFSGSEIITLRWWPADETQGRTQTESAVASLGLTWNSSKFVHFEKCNEYCISRPMRTCRIAEHQPCIILFVILSCPIKQLFSYPNRLLCLSDCGFRAF